MPQKEFVCALCSELYDDPCLLPCLHSFCRKCLVKRVKEAEDIKPGKGLRQLRSDYGALRCPTDYCQYVTTTPVSEIPGNHWLMNQVRIYLRVQEIVSESPRCEFCMEGGVAKLFCVECSKVICEECKGYHRRARDFHSHSLIDAVHKNGDKIKQAVTANVKIIPSCPAHGDGILKFYCTDCKKVICRDCISTGHNGHSCTMIDNAKSSSLDNFKKLQVDIGKQGTKVTTAIEEGNATKKAVAEKGQVVKQMVNSAIDELVATLETRRAELLKECDNIVNAKQARLDLQLESLRNLGDRLTHCVGMVSSTIENESAYDFLLLESVLSARIDDLTDQVKSQKLIPCTTCSIITDVDVVEMKKSISKLGQIRKGCYPPLCVLDVPVGKSIEVPSSGSKALCLTTMDDDGDRMTYGGEDVSVVCSSSCVHCTSEDNHDGTYTIALNPVDLHVASSSITMEITINKVAISEHCFAMHVTPVCIPTLSKFNAIDDFCSKPQELQDDDFIDYSTASKFLTPSPPLSPYWPVKGNIDDDYPLTPSPPQSPYLQHISQGAVAGPVTDKIHPYSPSMSRSTGLGVPMSDGYRYQPNYYNPPVKAKKPSRKKVMH